MIPASCLSPLVGKPLATTICMILVIIRMKVLAEKRKKLSQKIGSLNLMDKEVDIDGEKTEIKGLVAHLIELEKREQALKRPLAPEDFVEAEIVERLRGFLRKQKKIPERGLRNEGK